MKSVSSRSAATTVQRRGMLVKIIIHHSPSCHRGSTLFIINSLLVSVSAGFPCAGQKEQGQEEEAGGSRVKALVDEQTAGRGVGGLFLHFTAFI